MEDPRIIELLYRQHGVITRRQAIDTGFTSRQVDHRVKTRQWLVASHGVYHHAQMPATWRGRLLAACHVHRGIASHRSAAALHGIDGYQAGPHEVTVPDGRWRPAEIHVSIHQSTQLDRAELTTIDSIPCTGMSRTVLDLAAVVGRQRLDFTIDAVLRSGQLTLPDLCEVLSLHSRRGRDGCGRLRIALDERVGVGAVPLSDWSRMVHDMLVLHGLPMPKMEYRVVRSDGSLIAQVDLAYPDARVAIELDSVAWHLNRESFEKDPRRRNRLIVAGWNVLNFTWADYIDRPSVLCGTVRSALSQIKAS